MVERSPSFVVKWVLLQVRRRHREQLMQLLRVMRKVDLLESRFASALGHWLPQRSATSELERQLSALEGEMGPSASGKPSNLAAISRAPSASSRPQSSLAAAALSKRLSWGASCLLTACAPVNPFSGLAASLGLLGPSLCAQAEGSLLRVGLHVC